MMMMMMTITMYSDVSNLEAMHSLTLMKPIQMDPMEFIDYIGYIYIYMNTLGWPSDISISTLQPDL